MAWRDAGALAEFPDGGLRRVDGDGGRAVVVVRRGARLWALRDTCPHQGARLSRGTVCGRVVPCLPGQEIHLDGQATPVLRCPWHGWEFDAATGSALVDVAHARVRAYEVKVAQGRVLVAMEA